MSEVMVFPGRVRLSHARGLLGLVIILNLTFMGMVFGNPGIEEDNISPMKDLDEETPSQEPEPIIQHKNVEGPFVFNPPEESSAPFPVSSILFFGALAGGAGMYYWIFMKRK